MATTTSNSESTLDEGREIATIDNATAVAIGRAEIDQQVATAHAYPRSIKRFMEEARTLATLTEDVAEECMYALPRDGKTIEGPSARFAEIIASAWGNCRAGGRVVAEEAEFVVGQGVMHDLEKNVAITYEVKRRITVKNGRRFSSDMIGVTGNAAASIAMRNAVLKVIPKALWNPIWQEARRVAIGDQHTLKSRRDGAIGYFAKMGVQPERICAVLGVEGVEDIGLDELAKLTGIKNALKDGDTTVDQVFAEPKKEVETAKVSRTARPAPEQSAGKPQPVADTKPAATAKKDAPPLVLTGDEPGGESGLDVVTSLDDALASLSGGDREKSQKIEAAARESLGLPGGELPLADLRRLRDELVRLVRG